MSKPSDTYFETLGAALISFGTQIIMRGGVFLPDENLSDKFDGGVSYGQTVSRSFELLTYKGKKTKKFAHATLYRMESGRYELTNYIL